jgi:diguanylate cyclase (GGDEF)-like protein/PAS domain S-box-containing protein
MQLAMADEPKLDPAGREAVLAATLAQHPGTFIAAIAPTGLFTDLPEELTRTGHRPIEGPRSALGLVTADDQRTVIDAWHRALNEGVANCLVHPIAAPERQVRLHIIDLTHRLGIFVGLLTGMEEHEATLIPHQEVRPRLVVVHKDQTAVITGAGSEVGPLLGYAPDELIGRRSLDLVHPDDHERAIASWMDMLSTPAGAARRVRLRHLHRDGHAVWFEITNHNHLADPQHPGVVAEMLDISDEMAAQEAVRAAEQLMRRLTETLPMGILQVGADRRVSFVNDRAARLAGARVGDPLRLDAIAAAVTEVLASAGDADLEYGRDGRRIRANLRALTDDTGAVTGAIICLADVTEEVRLREELRHRATYDPLTGCFNRAATLATLEDPADGAGTAVVFCDLNGFKQVNDRYGHAAGDRLLTHVAARLRLAIGGSGVVGRIGGDEFLVICRDVAGPAQARQIGTDLLAALSDSPVEFDGHVLVPQVSVGVAWSRPGGAGPDDLVARADAAMYEAKKTRTGPLALVLAS